jgi:hypothetical protein
VDSPVPQDWTEHGAPPESVAAYAEGMCPVHMTPLEAGIIPFGGKRGTPRAWVPGGWCEQCRAWWHRPHDVRTGITLASGLGATWNVTGVRS